MSSIQDANPHEYTCLRAYVSQIAKTCSLPTTNQRSEGNRICSHTVHGNLSSLDPSAIE
jgi:hypothetical protein